MRFNFLYLEQFKVLPNRKQLGQINPISIPVNYINGKWDKRPKDKNYKNKKYMDENNKNIKKYDERSIL